MKNNIYSIVQNALVIDDLDTPLSYKKSNVDNTVYIKVQTLDELFNMFLNDNNSIFCCTCDKFLSVILDDNTEIPIYKFDPDKMSASFLKISNKQTYNEMGIEFESGFEFYISVAVDHDIADCKWQIETKLIDKNIDEKLTSQYPLERKAEASNIMGGYEATYKIFNYSKKYKTPDYTPAVKYCYLLHKPPYSGYLPSAGEIYCFKKYLDMVNFLFEKWHMQKIDMSDKKFWTSTENTFLTSYIITDKDGRTGLESLALSGKPTVNKVLPFFKKTN